MLLFVALLPFSTALMVTHLSGPDINAAVLIYGINLLLASLMLSLLMFDIVSERSLVLDKVADETLEAKVRHRWTVIAVNIVGIAVAIVLPLAAVGLYVVDHRSRPSAPADQTPAALSAPNVRVLGSCASLTQVRFARREEGPRRRDHPRSSSTWRTVASWFESSELVTDGLGAAVLKEHAVIASEGSAAKRRLDADARGASGEHQGFSFKACRRSSRSVSWKPS